MMRSQESSAAPISPASEDSAPFSAATFHRGLFGAAVLIALLIAGAIVHTLFATNLKLLSEFFFYEQDLLVAVAFIIVFAALCLPWRWRLPFELRPPAATWRTALLLALLVIAVGYAGSYLFYDDYALSMDEFMARFDAQILASGHLAAPVPPQWRDYVKALQPIFLLDIPGHAYWVSSYLPVNAAFLALGLKLGAMNLMPALWAGVGVLATFGVARQLWPEKPGVALIAAVLLATSPQLLITAMTPYAMSAHLALNMVWLWLYLRGGRLGHGLAAPVAFLATGLHQIVFHPLFAAPFVLELWLQKRWKPALWHTVTYGAIGVFWALYQPMLVHLYSAGTVAQAVERHGALASLQQMVSVFDPMGLGYLAKNLIRLVTWQNLLLAPLALLALMPAVRARGMLRALVIGPALTLAMLLIVMPYQGHGWGFRYLHGFIGVSCLLAAWSWTRLSEAASADPTAQRAIFAFALAASLAALLPLRVQQAHAFEHPYAVAAREIEALPADVVIVDSTGVWFGKDLVRNRPRLGNRPIVIDALSLATAQRQALCAGRSVIWFTPDDAKRLGVRRARAQQGADARGGC
jgi:hypothetical protein